MRPFAGGLQRDHGHCADLSRANFGQIASRGPDERAGDGRQQPAAILLPTAATITGEDQQLITIDARAPGRRRPLIPQWQIPLPPDPTGRDEPLTLRALISRIVASEVAAFRERQDRQSLVRVLSAREIEEGAAKGKVDSGGRDLHQTVDEGQAIGTALQAFEDGLYLVIIDGREQRDLDEQVFPGPDSHVTFLRLVMLAGA